MKFLREPLVQFYLIGICIYGHSVKPFEQSASDPKRTFGMSKNKSSEVRIPPAPLMISDGGLAVSGL